MILFQTEIDCLILDTASKLRMPPCILDSIINKLIEGAEIHDYDILRAAFYANAKTFKQCELKRMQSNIESEQLKGEFAFTNVPLFKITSLADNQRKLLITYSTRHTDGRIKFYQLAALRQSIRDVDQVKRIYDVNSVSDAVEIFKEKLYPILNKILCE